MVFVPCRNRKSHTPEEWAAKDGIGAGAAVILNTFKSLNQSMLQNSAQYRRIL